MELVKGFNRFNKIDEAKKSEKEEELEAPFRLYGEESTPQAELITELKDLISFIKKANPKNQKAYDKLKEDILSKKESIMEHANYEEFKTEGFEWQDETFVMNNWQDELAEALTSLSLKAEKLNLV